MTTKHHIMNNFINNFNKMKIQQKTDLINLESVHKIDKDKLDIIELLNYLGKILKKKK